ncbi:MAG: trehalose-phosphatase [Erythrobacter sp.]|uniref:trehalose-phosphatase n=1 Tax=Erythrobacter sp. TaxID=1042 RepID=UPI002605385C|nr:trehalose-phosphatase [Erythrobacter sp.]MDJ0979008.1 trehalose-phosphatase [Erythrobacter sp.]
MPLMTASPLSPPPLLGSLREAGPVALFVDFDGTLVEIAPTPDAIDVPARLGERLAALSDGLDGACALVSGRSLQDLARYLGGPLPVTCAGSHGADIRTAEGTRLGAAPEGVPDAIAEPMRAYALREGLDYEAKPHGAALHYRALPIRGPAAQAFAKALAKAHGWSAQAGKSVIELVPAHTDKGSAVRTLMKTAAFSGARPCFIGDDLTDEKGMAACTALGGTGILVGDREPTIAQHRLPDVASVYRWLGL